MKIRNVFLLIVSVLLMQGCVDTGRLKPNQKIKQENGIYIISVTRTGVGMGFGVGIKKPDNSIFYATSHPTSSIESIEDGKSEGNLYVYEGKPGIYKLINWQLYNTGGLIDRLIQPKKIEPITFEVKAGKITYLGNYHADVLYGKNILGIDIPAGAKITISDKEYRDLSIAKKEHPNIANMPVLKSVSNIQNWGLE